MATDATGALIPALDARAQRITLIIASLAWWAWLGALVWVCFLREGQRGLGLTLQWFAQAHVVTVAVAVILLTTGLFLLLQRGGSARAIGAVNLACGALQGLLISPLGALLAPLP